MRPASTEHPSTVEQVQQVARTARTHRLKAIGSGHSFTGIGLTDGVLVSLDRMDRVLQLDALAEESPW